MSYVEHMDHAVPGNAMFSRCMLEKAHLTSESCDFISSTLGFFPNSHAGKALSIGACLMTVSVQPSFMQ